MTETTQTTTPGEMKVPIPNTNCLENIACPKCGHDARFYIDVKALAVVTDDGAETFGDMEWDDGSYTECSECGHHGSLGEFHIDPAKENATRTRKE